MGYFRFFFQRLDFFSALYPIKLKNKNFNKKSFKLLFIKVEKFHGDSVKNESARTKKLQGGGAKHSPPQPV